MRPSPPEPHVDLVERVAGGGAPGGLADPPATWTGLMAGFAPAPTDRASTGTFDQGGPIWTPDLPLHPQPPQ